MGISLKYTTNSYVDNGGLRLSCPSEPVSVYDWLKNEFVTHEINAEAALYSLASYG